MKTGMTGSVLIGVLLLHLPVIGFAFDQVEPKEWSTEVRQKLREAYKKGRHGVSQIIYNELEDIDVLDAEIGDKVELNLSLHRFAKVNHDRCNSWTVIDKIKGKIRIPLFSEMMEAISKKLNVGFYVGNENGFETMNIRQVLPNDSMSTCPLPKLDDLKEGDKKRAKAIADLNGNPILKGRRNDRWGRPGSVKEGKVQAYTVMDNEKEKELFFVDSTPEKKAHYSRLWNLLTHPFRIPISSKTADHMEIGEVMSYVITGGLVMGPHVGWSGSYLDAGMNFRTLHEGSFRISILKEEEKVFRVKFSRVKRKGRSFGANAKLTVPLSGAFIFDIFDEFTFAKFSMTLSKTVSKIFDTAFRFDLDVPQAERAYQKALRGGLDSAEKWAFNAEGVPRKIDVKGVEWVGNAKTVIDSKGRRSKVSLRIKKRKRSGEVRFERAEITTPDGKIKTYKSSSYSQVSWQNFWGNRETIQYKFNVYLDPTRYDEQNKNDPRAISMVVTAFRKDSHTLPAELKENILWIEDFVNDFGIIPRPPKEMPGHAFEDFHLEFFDFIPRKHLGRSEYLGRLFLTPDQVQRVFSFISEKYNIPGFWTNFLEDIYGMKRGAWDSSGEQWFGGSVVRPVKYFIPNLFKGILGGGETKKGGEWPSAWTLTDQWAKLSWKKDAWEKAKGLAKLFYSKKYSAEMVNAIKTVLKGEHINYELSVSNSLTGRIYRDGFKVADPGQTAHDKYKEIEAKRKAAFEAGQALQFDSETGFVSEVDLYEKTHGRRRNISQLRAVQLNEAVTRVEFCLAPEFIEEKNMDHLVVHLQLYDGEQLLADMPLYKRELEFLQSGLNQVNMDRLDIDNYWQDLARLFAKNPNPNPEYRFRMTTSDSNGVIWDPPIEYAFDYFSNIPSQGISCD